MENTDQIMETSPAPGKDLPMLAVTLLKGVFYRDDDPRLWESLLALRPRVSDHMAVLGLDLMLNEAEGYAFLRSRPDSLDESEPAIPRLIVRRQLSFPVSLLLALLRKKLAELDVTGGDTRLVLSLEEIVELVRVFLPQGSNEARLMDQIETNLNKVVDLGFLRKLKASGGQVRYEVRRIIKAFVDAQWLSALDERLAAYQAYLGVEGKGAADE